MTMKITASMPMMMVGPRMALATTDRMAPIKAKTQFFLFRAKMPPMMAMAPNTIAGMAKKVPGNGRPKVDTRLEYKTETTIPAMMPTTPATIVRIPRWSPNGESLAFEADPGGNQDVYVVSASGGTARRLTTDRDPDQWPDWSPDGQSLYFVRGGRATKDIWKIPVAGGEAVQITRNLMADIPQVSPDGSFIYYSKGWPYSLSIWRVPANGGESSKVLEWLPPTTWWTVTEEGIYFVSNTEDKRENDLSIYEFATGKTRNALTLEGRFGDMAVSRDRRTILFTKLDKVGSDLMLVENFR